MVLYYPIILEINYSLGIITRSKKASSGGSSWTRVPLPVKLTKVLIGELQSQMEEEEDDDFEEIDEEVCYGWVKGVGVTPLLQ